MKTISVKTKRLLLRDLQASDAKTYAKLGVSYYSTGKINTPQKAKEHIKRVLKSKDGFEWGIFLKDTGELIGVVELSHLSWFDHAAGEMSHNIQKRHQGRGYGLESGRALIDYCFDIMKLHKLYSDTDEGNEGAMKLLKKLGFKLEGVIREKHRINSAWIDELDYGLLRSEWKKR